MLKRIWRFIRDHPGASAVVTAIVFGVTSGIWSVFVYVVPPKSVVDVDVAAIVETVHEVQRRQFADSAQREERYRDQVPQLTDAVKALADERDKPDAPPGIDDALALLAIGNTEAAEAVFEEVKERRMAEGAEASKEAAAAARHIGALAFLHDTEKALQAYREATILDPDNFDGWNQLGLLLHRTGDLDSAEEMFRKALALNEALGRKEGMASAYGNLGILYQTRGDLDRAEQMYRNALKIDEALGRKEGMARTYGNLGILDGIREDLDRAERMFRKALELNEALERKEGMAANYSNLGIIYAKRGDLDRAEEMFRESLNIAKDFGGMEVMAMQYGSLGNLYKIRREFDRAEKMYREGLAIDEALGRKHGMAAKYANLGKLSEIRGDLDQAKEMYAKSLELFGLVGANREIEQVEGWLAELPGRRK